MRYVLITVLSLSIQPRYRVCAIEREILAGKGFGNTVCTDCNACPNILENCLIEGLERQCNGVPLKFGHETHDKHGRVNFFSFNKVELPALP